MEKKLFEKWQEQARDIPFVDTHSHVMPRGIAKHLPQNVLPHGQSRLAGLLTGVGSILSFRSAGMTHEEELGIRDGGYTREECMRAVLKYLPRVETMHPISCCIRGLSLLAGEAVEVNEGSWESLESLLGDGYDHVLHTMELARMEKAVLNFWPIWGAAYFGRYLAELSEEEKRQDRRAFAPIPTLDFHALLPFSAPTREYARLVGEDAESFAGYERLLLSLPEYLVKQGGARGFKITECYFRRLDYRRCDRAEAERCFRESRTPEDDRILGNFVAFTVLEEARRLGVPVQIHTGERWGDTEVADTSPLYLAEAIRSFPEVTFELLHGGYPFLAETGILAQNFHNVNLNLSYMSMHSLSLLEEWLEIYQNLIPADRISLGADVFDVECMAGCVDMIRGSCARVAARLDEQGAASDAAILRFLHSVCHKTAERTFGFGQD